MANVILYIAASLDGYIARKDGGIDWLSMVETPETDYGYADFYRTVDAIVVGSKTYEQALGFDQWPYPGKTTYVFTRRELTTDRDDVVFTSASPDAVISGIESKGLSRIWLIGGAELTASFLRLRLVDEFIISVIPIILGEGIPLFLHPYPEQRLKLNYAQQYPTGLVQMSFSPAE
ncbi:MAG TPA: dihydrofolate reductase family protein [Pyrinomonadaceae bacterium]|jgi:dihydrofolate reductase